MATETQTTDFPLSWADTADERLTWQFDPMHSPDVITPLGFDLYMEPFLRGFGMMRACLQNYYMYMAQRGTPPSPAASSTDPASIVAGGRRWRDVILPEVLQFDEHY